ncbi:uncharacterized protein BDR25DRAFT_381083 [Lindgomyces ingoldianus]|uniref:Uncharacterized protein n=1 Tax=Lindgomyces ingoldianus TaxID=673940 RepID=A0ACB6QC42_9PLEO|nr:uncharacterized protein BDR25DRAFT_381083 [Lindgomyces ingoldianus]KAF2464476.1 hypothetical protein BDR25DRAFT_381083 [Lindgomyces ingoldianus]
MSNQPSVQWDKGLVAFWSMTLRTQLKDTNIRVIEIEPPTLATNLYRERKDPNDNKKIKNPRAMSVEGIIEEMTKKRG